MSESERTMFLGPSLAHVGNELLFAGAHLADERLVAGLFMAGGPQNHFRKDGGEINSFRRQGVEHLSAVRGILLGTDNSVGFQSTEAVRQNVGSDFFVRVQKFVKGLVPSQHHVAQDQEGPAIAEHFNGSVERASGAALGRGRFFVHD